MKDIVFCKGGGCTAKLGAGALGKILEKLPAGDDPDLLVGNHVSFENQEFFMEEILFDPQTSGGLLVSVDESEAGEIAAKMNAENIPAQIVGYVTDRQEKSITVK